MKILSQKDAPEDFLYFRSSSEAYRAYLTKGGLRTLAFGKQYGWIKDVFGLFQVSKFERTLEPPPMEELRKHGFRRGIVIWIPWRTEAVPKGWRRLLVPGAHFSTTGFTTLSPEYWKTWNERARRSRKKFLQNPDISVRSADPDAFCAAFRATKVKHMFTSDYIRYYRSMVEK